MKSIKEHIMDENKIMTNFYETNYKYKLTQLNNHINKEPCKILKEKHKKWEIEKDLLVNDVKDSFNLLNKSYISIEDTLK